MQNNYQRLYDQLIQLISEKEVHDNLGNNLKARVQKLIKSQSVSELRQKGTQSCLSNHRYHKQTDISKKFEKIVLKDINYRQKTNRKTSNSGLGIKNSKHNQMTKKVSKSKQRLNSNDSRIYRQKSNQKGFSKYNTHQNSSSKLKSRANSKEIQNSKSHLKNYLEAKQRSNSKLKTIVGNKQNCKTYYTKPEKKRSTYLKTEADSQYSQIILTKNQSYSNRNSKNKQTLRKLAGIEPVPSRFEVSSSKKPSLSLQKQKQKMLTIQKKKEQIIEEKSHLQDSIRLLQQKINRQKYLMNQTENRIGKIQQEINKYGNCNKQKNLEQKISRKKSQSFMIQTKQIEEDINETINNNDKIVEAIVEQKYLIEMYGKVIDEMRSQLKVEKEQKLLLKKKTIQIKNSEKMIIEKHDSKQALSDQLFNAMQEILKKWE